MSEILIKDGVQCDVCGATLILNLPIRVEVVVSLLRSFAELHKFCVEGERPVFKPADNIRAGEGPS